MDKSTALFALCIIVTCAVVLAFVHTIQVEGDDIAARCSNSGGVPQKLNGAILCFAPGVLITPKE